MTRWQYEQFTYDAPFDGCAGGGVEPTPPTRILLLEQDYIEADVTQDQTRLGDRWTNERDAQYTYEYEFEITNNVGTNNSIRATNSMYSFGLFSTDVSRTYKSITFTAVGSTRTGEAIVCRLGSSGNSYHVKIWNLKIWKELV